MGTAASKFSISNPQQVFQLAKVTFEPHAFGNLEARDDAALDLLAALSGALASWAAFPARPVQVSSEFVVLARLKLNQQLFDGLSLTKVNEGRLANQFGHQMLIGTTFYPDGISQVIDY
jgi:hypothetical protein